MTRFRKNWTIEIFNGDTWVRAYLKLYDNIDEVIHNYTIAKKIYKNMANIRIAEYYGCYFAKPHKVIRSMDAEV